MKKYALLMMLLIGLLIPMTVASKTLDTSKVAMNNLIDNMLIDYSVVTVSMQPLKIKYTYGEEVAVQDIRCSEYLVSSFDVARLHEQLQSLEANVSNISIRVRYQADSIKGLEVDNLTELQNNRFNYLKQSYIIYDDPGINTMLDKTNYNRTDTIEIVGTYNSLNKLLELEKGVLLNVVFG